MTRFLTAITAIAILSACSSRDEEQSARAPEAAEAQPAAIDAMPENFQGKWDFAAEDCDDPASEQQLEIGPDEARYYESSAELTAIEQTGDNSLTVEHHFTGQGEEWDETLGYELSDDGDRLTVTTPEGSMSIRARCP